MVLGVFGTLFSHFGGLLEKHLILGRTLLLRLQGYQTCAGSGMLAPGRYRPGSPETGFTGPCSPVRVHRKPGSPEAGFTGTGSISPGSPESRFNSPRSTDQVHRNQVQQSMFASSCSTERGLTMHTIINAVPTEGVSQPQRSLRASLSSHNTLHMIFRFQTYRHISVLLPMLHNTN